MNAAVFHRGALGDSVLVWPLLRALAARFQSVAFITDLEKAQLARRVAVPNLVTLSAEQPQFNRLFVNGAKIEVPEGAAGLKLVLHLTPNTPLSDSVFTTWHHNARLMFPGARIVIDQAELHRGHALELAQQWGDWNAVADRPPPLPPTGSGICLSVGAGSAEKRWPLPLWVQVARELAPAPVRLIAGEVEHERFSPPERAMFERAGGVYLQSLEQLEQMLRTCAVFAGADSGPTHVAAGMSLTTLALFGPTDPTKWAPIGPRVAMLAPEYPRGMAWLTIPMVVERLRTLLPA